MTTPKMQKSQTEKSEARDTQNTQMRGISHAPNQSFPSRVAEDARFALARAQQAAYYAHKHLIEHPGQLDAQAS